MAKVNWKPGNMLYPLPAVMVSCGESPEEYNIITIAWTGIVSSNPPRTYISIRPERYSYDIINRTRAFVINLTNKNLVRQTDWCGVRSGKNFDKFKEMELTAVKASIVNAPFIEESPVHLECKVFDILPMGSHDMFLADIVNVAVDEQFLDAGDVLNFERIHALAYAHGYYYELGNPLGKFGFSVKRKDADKKRK
jgi:flavin reductase (DIM6/NTAB) family NADH-FMN oxidoreductase RutF